MGWQFRKTFNIPNTCGSSCILCLKSHLNQKKIQNESPLPLFNLNYCKTLFAGLPLTQPEQFFPIPHFDFHSGGARTSVQFNPVASWIGRIRNCSVHYIAYILVSTIEILNQWPIIRSCRCKISALWLWRQWIKILTPTPLCLSSSKSVLPRFGTQTQINITWAILVFS